MRPVTTQGERGADLLTEQDLTEIEAMGSELTSSQVVELFRSRGIRLSEATFRKYVQLGLLPRSRRVGRKGKHQGSLGLYPTTTVRRINEVKRMMGDSYTIEEIQRSFLRFRDEIEVVSRALASVFEAFGKELSSDAEGRAPRARLGKEIEDAQRVAADLLSRLEKLERQITSPLERAARARVFSSGASGGAGDLL